MSRPLVIIGCGGFGREVHDVVDAINADHAARGLDPAWDMLGYLDDNPSDFHGGQVVARGSQVLGGLDWLASADPAVAYVIGIGSPAIKARIDAALPQRTAATLVHPAATLGANVTLGPGTIVCAGVCITTNIQLGRHVHINLLCSIGHDTQIDDYVSINPLVAVSGTVHLQEGVMVGTHASILQNLTIGTGSVVGGAACVVKNVPPGVVAKGVPATW